jgi:S-adenosylmethionine decarboxylase
VLDHLTIRSDELRARNQDVREMRLYAMDAWVRRAAILTDRDKLERALFAAAEQGGACVVGQEFFVFPNGAVTGVLLLAQSHLSLHTWPELALANVDLLSYGDVRGEVVLQVLREELGAERVRISHIRRALG